MSSTRVSRRVNAPCSIVYRALLDAHAVAMWKVPTGMTSHVHAFDAREGGSFRIVADLRHNRPGLARRPRTRTRITGVLRSSYRTSRLSKWSSSRRQIPLCAMR